MFGFAFILFQLQTLKRSHETLEMPIANDVEKSPFYMRKLNWARFWAMHGKPSGSGIRRTMSDQWNDNDKDEEQNEQPQRLFRSKLNVLHHVLRIKRRYKPTLPNTKIPIASRFSQEGEYFQKLAQNEILQKQRRAEGGTVMVRMM